MVEPDDDIDMTQFEIANVGTSDERMGSLFDVLGLIPCISLEKHQLLQEL